MTLLKLALWICAGFVICELMYQAGREASRRECPPAQHGERLLASEQRAKSTVCTYAGGWNGYGRGLKARSI